MRRFATLAKLVFKMFPDAIRHMKLQVGVAVVEFLCQPYLFGTQRLSVRFSRVLFMWGAVADMTTHDNQRGPVMRIEERFVSLCQLPQIVCITDVRNIPSVTREPCSYIFRKSEAGRPLDGDAIVVINP